MGFKKIPVIGKLAIVLAAVVVVTFTAAFVFFFRPGDLTLDNYDGSYNLTDETRRFTVEDIEEIIVTTAAADISVYSTSDQEGDLRIEAVTRETPTEEKLNDLVKIGNEEGRFSVRTEIPGPFPWGIRRLRISLAIPEKYSGTLKITTASGDVLLSELSLGKTDIKAASGNIDVLRSGMTRLTLDTSSGDIDLKSVTVEETLNTETTSGNIGGDTISASSILLTTTSGEIDMTGVRGSMTSKSVSGDQEIGFLDAQNALELSSTSGNIDIYLPGEKMFRTTVKTVSGDIDSDWPVTLSDSIDAGVLRETGEVPVRIKTTSGNIDIKKISR